MILGFSTGCLHKTHDRLAPSTFDIFRKLGCDAIEIMYHDIEDTADFSRIVKDDLEGFGYVSVHAPALGGRTPVECGMVLDAIAGLHGQVGLEAVVLHPDGIEDWGFFGRFDLPFAIENMDWRKDSCKNVSDLKNVFSLFDAKMVLDVNHCYTNDPTMKLAEDLVREFGSRICQVHLSGFESFHEPIHVTGQKTILDAVPDKSLPIILEGGMDDIDAVRREFEYVKNFLQS